jgi:hypothetical protein
LVAAVADGAVPAKVMGYLYLVQLTTSASPARDHPLADSRRACLWEVKDDEGIEFENTGDRSSGVGRRGAIC